MKLEYTISDKDNNKILKDIVRNKNNISARLFNKLKLNHHIYINNSIAYANDVVKEGDKITIDLDYEEDDLIAPEKGEINILYEDEWYLAISKKANMVVHPSVYHQSGTLSNFVKYYFNTSGCINKKIRPVNRLDNGTSGIVLFAKNELAQERFKYITPKPIKKYISICMGLFDKKEGILSFPIARKEGSIIERCVDFEKGQSAITKYKVTDEFSYGGNNYSIVEIILETGRTHQIRVHMAYIGHPLVGDTLYNSYDKKEVNKVFLRQALHAYELSFIHPFNNKNVSIIAPIEEDILNLIKLKNI